MLKRFFKYIRNQYYQSKFRNKKVRFFSDVVIDGNCVFEGYNSVGEKSIVLYCAIGKGSYISENANLANVKIGRFCSIGANIRNTRGRHPITNFVSTHPAFFATKNPVVKFSFTSFQKFSELKRNPDNRLVTIGNDVWIGDNVIILDGITIGDGAVIGAGSVVTKDVEPYSINVGVPAKMIKYRFKQDDIDFLLKYKWWDRDFIFLGKMSDQFEDISKLRSYLENSAQ